jgi:hypothetical protein
VLYAIVRTVWNLLVSLSGSSYCQVSADLIGILRDPRRSRLYMKLLSNFIRTSKIAHSPAISNNFLQLPPYKFHRSVRHDTKLHRSGPVFPTWKSRIRFELLSPYHTFCPYSELLEHSPLFHKFILPSCYLPVNLYLMKLSVARNIQCRMTGKRWSYPCNRPWRHIALWDVEAPTFSRQSAHKWRWGQPYAPAVLYHQEDSWYLFLLEAESTPGP